MKFLLRLLISSSLLMISQGTPAFSKENVELLDIAKSPTQAEWRTFNNLSSKKILQLWSYHSARGKKLTDWSWEWRIGWVRSCLKPNNKAKNYCLKVIKDGLSNDALVVRSETAKHLGISYQGSENSKIIKMLVQAYKDKRNQRNQKPLFIQKYILFSLSQIQGKEAKYIGETLANRHSEMKLYWQKINRF